jgi:beta-glucosidase
MVNTLILTVASAPRQNAARVARAFGRRNLLRQPPSRMFSAGVAAGVLALSAAGAEAGPPADELLARIPGSFAFAAGQYERLLGSVKDDPRLPRTFAGGKLRTVAPEDWTSGFFPGSLWLLHEFTGDPKWFNAATNHTERLDAIKNYRGNHDVGFMLGCSYGNGHRLTKNPAYRKVLLQGAQSLASRFDVKAGLIRSWDFGKWQYPVIVDNMMNLELLMWAAREGGDPRLREIAVAHADKTLRNHFRPDHSSYHLVDYNPASGEVLRKQTVQGRADDSSWARGQAWGLYGFTMMAREAGNPAYLAQATNIANFILHHPRLPADKVPYWDFDAPDIPAAPRDASAAAIMSSALIELSGMVDAETGRQYLALARRQLLSLSSPAYCAEPGGNGNFILRHCVGHLPEGKEVDVPLSYADYYYLEGLMRYRRRVTEKENQPALTPLRADLYHDGWVDLNKNGVKDPYEDRAVEAEARITDLLGRMTLEEKTAQMATLYGFPRVLKDELPAAAWTNRVWKDGIGNIDEHLNGNAGEKNNFPIAKHSLPWPLHTRALNEVQKFFIEQTRLGIPADFTDEGIRGLLHSRATSFPAQIAVASAWDKELASGIGRVTGREAKALGYGNVYSPVLDLPRDPRWGRIVECYSEDPFLTAELGVRQVQGIQSQRVVSTLKHFAVYSVPKGGRDGESRTDPQVTWNEVQTVFLHPFRRAIRDGGALGVMASYNDYNGVPIAANRLFLTDILRREFGFRGYVVSDSKAVEFIHQKHRVAADYPDAIRQSVEAGLNVRTDFTGPEVYVEPLRQLVRDGKLSSATIDARVRDILRVKMWEGLFDEPYRNPDAVEQIVRAPEHLAVAARAARESIILLKNDGNTLPLRQGLRKIAVIGPLADNAGAWRSRYGPQQLEFVTVLAGLRKKLGSSCEVVCQPGCDVVDENFPESDVLKGPPPEKVRAGIVAAAAAAKGCDAAILVLGENDAICRESASRISLNLPGYQEELLEAVHATGTPVVLLLSNGRPLSVNWAAKHVPAIVEMWFPGEAGGDAVADVLFGDYNPAGRLPVTVPRSVGQIPLNFPARPGSQSGDPGQVSGPLWPFGHGLSYTTFSYTNLVITPREQGPQGNIEIAVDITNTGPREGDEVVQLYLRDDYSSVTTFEKSLRGFERVHLQPGERRTVKFTLTPEHLALFDRDQHWTVEPGRFTVMIGASSEDIRVKGVFEITGDSPRLEKTGPEPCEHDPI